MCGWKFFVFKALEINGEGNGNNEGAAQHPDLVLQMQENRLREKIKKQSRTHALLVSIVVVFALSWLPLNVLNIILDVSNIFSVSNQKSNNFHAKTIFQSHFAEWWSWQDLLFILSLDWNVFSVFQSNPLRLVQWSVQGGVPEYCEVMKSNVTSNLVRK